MQNIWMAGLMLVALLGTGTFIGMGAMQGEYGMHHMMHGDNDVDCQAHQECDQDHQDCEELNEEYCLEEHEDCDHHGEMHEHGSGHGC